MPVIESPAPVSGKLQNVSSIAIPDRHRGRFTGRHSELRLIRAGGTLFSSEDRVEFRILGVAEILCRAISVVVILVAGQTTRSVGIRPNRVRFQHRLLAGPDRQGLLRDDRHARDRQASTADPERWSITSSPSSCRSRLGSLRCLVGDQLLGVSQTRWIDGFLSSTGSCFSATAMGLDFVFRGNEAMGLVALSLVREDGGLLRGGLVLGERPVENRPRPGLARERGVHGYCPGLGGLFAEVWDYHGRSWGFAFSSCCSGGDARLD